MHAFEYAFEEGSFEVLSAYSILANGQDAKYQFQ